MRFPVCVFKTVWFELSSSESDVRLSLVPIHNVNATVNANANTLFGNR